MQTGTDYKCIFDTVPSLLLVLKPDSPRFTIVDANGPYLAATMKKREEVIDRGLFEVFPDNPNDPSANGVSNLAASLNRVLAKKIMDTMPTQKYDVFNEKGEVFEQKFWNPKNSPVLNDENELIYILHQVEDVTAFILSEERRNRYMRQANAELEKKSQFIEHNHNRIRLVLNALMKYAALDFSERLPVSADGDELDAIARGLNSLVDALELQMQQLKQFNTDLEYANKELDAFSYSVSHDLRAPLRAINGYAQMLVEEYGDKLDDQGRHIISVITRNAFKMGTLIDDLLTFSRIGKQDLIKTTLNMDSLFQSVIDELVDPAQKDRTDIHITHLQNTEGDHSMIRQVITNLMSNALKYSAKKERSVIEAGSSGKNGMVIYFVKDNGAGFDMKYYNKLFGVFQRLHSSFDFEGTGVGLALVQRIIKKHGGEIWAESTPGEGATFYFSLPLTDVKT